jgi:outer membrane protein
MSRLFLLGILFAFVTPRLARAEDLKIGYVDMQRAVGETDDGKKARAALKKVFDQKQKELDEQQEALKKKKEDFDKKRTLLSADKVREKETELQADFEKVQQSYMRHQRDLQEKEGEAMQKILERMNRIINKIAGAENFTMILDSQRSGLVFAKPQFDLTNELIRRYNSGEGAEGGGGKAPAKPAAPKK